MGWLCYYKASIPINPRTAPTLAPTAAVGKEAAPVKVAALADALNVGLWTAREVLLTLLTPVRVEDPDAIEADAYAGADVGAAVELGTDVAYIEADDEGVASASKG